jgi:hypothetical protein
MVGGNRNLGHFGLDGLQSNGSVETVRDWGVNS